MNADIRGLVDQARQARLGRVESVVIPPEERKAVEEAITSLQFEVTVGDVCARTGLKPQEADSALQRLASDSLATIRVSESGMLMYSFPQDFKGRIAAKSALIRFEPQLEAARGALAFVGRFVFGLALFASLAVIGTAAASGRCSLQRWVVCAATYCPAAPFGRRRQLPCRRRTTGGAVASAAAASTSAAQWTCCDSWTWATFSVSGSTPTRATTGTGIDSTATSCRPSPCPRPYSRWSLATVRPTPAGHPPLVCCDAAARSLLPVLPVAVGFRMSCWGRRARLPLLGPRFRTGRIFGAGDPNVGHQQELRVRLGEYIKSRGGVLTAEEMVPFLPDPTRALDGFRSAERAAGAGEIAIRSVGPAKGAPSLHCAALLLPPVWRGASPPRLAGTRRWCWRR